MNSGASVRASEDAGGHRITPFSGSTDLNQIESNMNKQPELYVHCAPCNHSVHCKNMRGLDKYATRLIKGSSPEEAFVSSFSSGDLNVAASGFGLFLVLALQLQIQLYI